MATLDFLPSACVRSHAEADSSDGLESDAKRTRVDVAGRPPLAIEQIDAVVRAALVRADSTTPPLRSLAFIGARILAPARHT